MKNIAILTCLKANDVCTGASCLDAFYNKKGFFTQYTNDDTKLVAFWTCNGCDEVLLNNQEGLLSILYPDVLCADAGQLKFCSGLAPKKAGGDQFKYSLCVIPI